MGLLDKLKSDVKKSGSNKGKFIYFREGDKQRVRFLNDMNDGMEVVFHDSFADSINVPCQTVFGKPCPYCEQEGLRTRSQYVWSVYNYETKEVQLFMFAVNNCSPIPALMAMYDTYGTMMDRDYVVSTQGKGTNKTFSVVPMDKVKFRNDKAKAFAEKTVLSMINKAWPSDASDDDEDEVEEVVKTKSKSKAKAKVEESDDDDIPFGKEESEATDYEDMSAKDLYTLAKKRKLDVEPKKPAKYYIAILEEADNADDDWGDEEDEDEWED